VSFNLEAVVRRANPKEAKIYKQKLPDILQLVVPTRWNGVASDNRRYGCERALGVPIQNVERSVIGDEEVEIDVRVRIYDTKRCTASFPSGQHIRKRLESHTKRFSYPVANYAIRCRHGRSCRLTPRFSGGAMSRAPWHLMHDRPLQPLVIPITIPPRLPPTAVLPPTLFESSCPLPDIVTDTELTTPAARSLTACSARAHFTTRYHEALTRAEPDL
jgi:hypothetical protein